MCVVVGCELWPDHVVVHSQSGMAVGIMDTVSPPHSTLRGVLGDADVDLCVSTDTGTAHKMLVKAADEPKNSTQPLPFTPKKPRTEE